MPPKQSKMTICTVHLTPVLTFNADTWRNKMQNVCSGYYIFRNGGIQFVSKIEEKWLQWSGHIKIT
jgi:hypothetical protein